METKQIIFVVMTFTFIPMAAWMGIAYRWAERLLIIGAFFSTSYLIDINLVSREEYRGDTRGFEFGVTDWMALALLIVMAFSPRWRSHKLELLPPNAVPILFYFLLATFSALTAYVTLFAGFGLLKLARGFLVFLAAYNYLRHEKDIRFILLILAGIVGMEFFLVVHQRLIGIYRAFGSTPHSNTLAVYINLFNMIFFAFILGEKTRDSWIHWVCLGMGTLMVLATFSRGALVAMVMGYLLVAVLSLFVGMRRHKLRVLGMLFLLALPVAIKVGPAIIDRFLHAPEASGESRGLANQAALTMANDHFFGVGINNYSYAINETDYIRFIDNPVDRGIVHNIYLLHACETGWMGLLAFLVVILRFFHIGLAQIRSRHDNSVTTFAIGIVAAMGTLWFQSLLEWLFRQTTITVAFFMLAGFLAALKRLDRTSRKQRRLRTLYQYYGWLQQWWLQHRKQTRSLS